MCSEEPNFECIQPQAAAQGRLSVKSQMTKRSIYDRRARHPENEHGQMQTAKRTQEVIETKGMEFYLRNPRGSEPNGTRFISALTSRSSAANKNHAEVFTKRSLRNEPRKLLITKEWCFYVRRCSEEANSRGRLSASRLPHVEPAVATRLTQTKTKNAKRTQFRVRCYCLTYRLVYQNTEVLTGAFA